MRAAARIGITPNGVTATGFAVNCLAAVLVASGYLLPGGAIMLFGSGLDLLDGALARATGAVSRYGAVFDAVLDRYSEAVVLAGLVVYESRRGEGLHIALLFAAVCGSVLVSYVRARAEALNYALREGLFTRVERVVLTAVALMAAAWWEPALAVAYWLLAVLTLLTAAQRVYHVWAKAREGEVP